MGKTAHRAQPWHMFAGSGGPFPPEWPFAWVLAAAVMIM